MFTKLTTVLHGRTRAILKAPILGPLDGRAEYTTTCIFDRWSGPLPTTRSSQGRPSVIPPLWRNVGVYGLSMFTGLTTVARPADESAPEHTDSKVFRRSILRPTLCNCGGGSGGPLTNRLN